MRVWRITRKPYQALDGEGGRLNGGRWNSEGVAVVYTSAALSLAALEYLVHVAVEDAPNDLVALEIDVPDDAGMEEVSAARLPGDWSTVEDHPACTSAGDAWARRGSALLLRVPSALIHRESNFLLNPKHPDAARVRVISVEDFTFDPRRLLRSARRGVRRQSPYAGSASRPPAGSRPADGDVPRRRKRPATHPPKSSK